MKYDLNKYNYYQFKNDTGVTTIIAISTYAGRRVKGYAKCDPRDTMSVQKGRELAAARCNAKIAAKRVRRAEQKYREASELSADASRHLYRMTNYYTDSVDQLEEANQHIEELVKSM